MPAWQQPAGPQLAGLLPTPPQLAAVAWAEFCCPGGGRAPGRSFFALWIVIGTFSRNSSGAYLNRHVCQVYANGCVCV